MPIVSTNTGPAKPRNFGFLKVKVARIIGGARNPRDLEVAGELINDRIIDFNQKLYECNKVETGTLTVTDGVVSLPVAAFKEIEFRLVDSTGAKIRQLLYKDFAEFHQVWNLDSVATTGNSPMYYTLFNLHLQGQLKLLPTPTGTDYVAGSYYRRFNLLFDDDDVLDAPQEIERALVLGAQFDILCALAPENPLVNTYGARAMQAWDAFVVIDRKHEDNHMRFRLAPLAHRVRLTGNQIYI